MESASSNNSTSSGVMTPATSPAKSAARGGTRPAHALEVTRPASHPLAQRLASGLPKRTRVTVKVATRAAAAQSRVLIAVRGRAVGAAFSQRIEPAMFQASHPTSASRQPKRT